MAQQKNIDDRGKSKFEGNCGRLNNHPPGCPGPFSQNLGLLPYMAKETKDKIKPVIWK